MTFLDEPVYPFHLPAAQQLYDTLVTLYPSNQGALLIAKRAQIDTTFIFEQQAVAYLWKDILETAATAHRLHPLVRDVHDRLRYDHPARGFLADLLAGRTPPTSAEPHDADGTRHFLHDDDTISEPEALLFQDDLTLPVGRLPGLIRTLQKLVTLAPGVCKLSVDISGDGQYGTGFRVGADLLLTNWHVLHRSTDGTQATTVIAEFGYEDDGHGGVLAGKPMSCDPAAVAADKSDDWAVVRVRDALDEAWPALLLTQAAVPTRASAAYVIQHPLGGRKRVGFIRNQVSHVDERVVHYLTDTYVGSSGSPVVDGDGRLIALHHRGGLPQTVAGKPPLRKNEGIRISRVVESMRQHGIAVV